VLPHDKFQLVEYQVVPPKIRTAKAVGLELMWMTFGLELQRIKSNLFGLVFITFKILAEFDDSSLLLIR